MSQFKEISPLEITENPFQLIGKDWLLVTAEQNQQCNMMTASWGGVGIMWNKPVAFTFIRPQRHTFGMLENSEYHFVVETDSELYVSGDAGRLEQVLYNLVNNAINHAGDDKTVILKCHREGKKARFDVIDHGSGIKKEDQPLIWNRYYRINKDKETGSGLGLSIVKTILELHKAEYGVESEVGKGSDFWFKLPLLEE